MLDPVTRDRWHDISPILDRALSLDPGSWPALLDGACSGDPELRAAVERLLQATTSGPRMLDAAADAVRALRPAEPPAIDGEQRVGPYRIIEEAGRGGMGVVYVAERADDQYRKRVALKLLRRGTDDPALVRRFREERQILATLDHPHIARLLDGGVTADDAPWFAMEFVDGEPIDQYCDRLRLSVEARLRLFLDVCDAVHFAHRNLVVHRDLKPSNILVTADGTVKLLDFGIARLLAADGTTDSTATRLGGRALTPAYASPEQLHGEPVAVPSDVYSLGVVLWELLAGSRLFSNDRRQALTVPEAPSLAAGRASAEVAAARGATPERLRRRLEGDLDTIVLMALRHEPGRRYDGADRLADDVRRHLDGRPVAARPDTLGYRLGKFARRHPAGLAAAGALLAVGAASAILMARESARTARERARAEQVSAFVTDLLQSPDPFRGQGARTTVREVLDSAAVRLDRTLGAAPATRADLLAVVARSYGALGLFDEAIRALDSAVAIRRRIGDDEGRLARDEVAYVGLLWDRGDAARPGLDSLLLAAVARARRSLREDPAALARVLVDASTRLSDLVGPDSAAAAATEALAIAERLVPPDSGLLALALFRRAQIHMVQLDASPGRAQSLVERAIALRTATLGPGHADLAALHELLGWSLLRQDRLPEAEREFRRALEIQDRALGPEHPDLWMTQFQLAEVALRRGAHAAADSMMLAAYAVMRATNPDVEDAYQADALGLRGVARLGMGDTTAADSLLRRSLRIHDGLSPSGNRVGYGNFVRALAELRTAQGRYAEAASEYRSLAEALDQWLGPGSEHAAKVRQQLARVYELWGRSPGDTARP